MKEVGNYTLTVCANRRPDNTEPVTWQARVAWGCPEQQVTGAQAASEILATMPIRLIPKE